MEAVTRGREDLSLLAMELVELVQGGGLAIVQGDVGYGLLTGTAAAARRAHELKGRAAHKRHGLLGNPNLRREIQILDKRADEMVDAITLDYGLPLGVIAPVRLEHPLVVSIDPDTFRAASVNGTMAMLHNNGALAERLAVLSLERDLALLGSSANLSGTGVKYRVEDIEPELVEAVDRVVDRGLCKYHLYRRSSTMIDFEQMRVTRIGACYEIISEILERNFGFACPPDPGREALPSGHLWEPDPQ